MTDARKMPILALFSSSSLNARLAMNSAIVKPMPARALPPASTPQPSCGRIRSRWIPMSRHPERSEGAMLDMVPFTPFRVIHRDKEKTLASS